MCSVFPSFCCCFDVLSILKTLTASSEQEMLYFPLKTVFAEGMQKYDVVFDANMSQKYLRRTLCVCVCVCVSVCICVYVLVIFLLLFPSRVGRTWASKSECKIDQTDFQVWCPSYHLVSWRKPSLIQKLSAEISKASAWNSWKNKIFRYKWFYIAIGYHKYIGNKYTWFFIILICNSFEHLNA